ncbi:MAG: YoaK family protein [Gordonia sp. (in: high G+C Gram-positive bacteria)]|uniref:YoaK family protein n=1 Tax=Gordonia sp. (in: high G+C Gram-positive bacteria) TaxID=84139 RepID=UPI0039E5BF3F
MTLSATAGYLDAVGFLHLRRHFVSFMSGNTTDLATEIGGGRWGAIGLPAALIGCFFAGTVLGAILVHVWDGRTTVLGVTALLVVATAIAVSVTSALAPVVVGLPLAMGVVNATFLRGGETSIGLTYMTGALVKAGQRLVDAFRGGPRFLWLRNLALWAALLAGGITGAVGHGLLGMPGALWPPAALLIVLTVVVAADRRRRGIFGSGAHTATEREIKVL